MVIKRTANKRTSMTINAERRLMLERLAVDASKKVDQTINWTDIVNYMIDYLSDDAVKDIIHSLNTQKN